ncbi:anti-repressor SinI family protein [Alteribacillus sp. YIM 98480]|nr:anti-repressor SinI family protein [Alteribacillus sp. YIM 98480]
MSGNNHDMKLDEEWIVLINEAKNIGLTPYDVLSFLRFEQNKK